MTAEGATTKRSWGNLSVRVKIATSVVLALVVAVLVGLTALSALGKTFDATERMYVSNIASVSAIGQVRSVALQTRLDVANHGLARTAAGRQKYRQAIDADEQAMADALDAYRNSFPAGDPATIDAVATSWDQFTDLVRQQLVPAADRGDFTGWQRVRDGQVIPLMSGMAANVAELSKAEQADARRAVDDASSNYRNSRILVTVLLVLGAVAALGLGLGVARGIVRSLNRVREVCEALAEGDLTRTADLRSGDEVGRMGHALDRAVVNLNTTVATIDQSAVSLAGAAEEMATVSAQIASSAAEASTQAQSVTHAAEEVSRSVHTVSAAGEEMGSSIQEIARNANDAARVAADAVRLAEATNTTVGKLGDSSAEIGNVITSITSIAEQTNLLALNATIEAARAGEAGKGFAVVATEVKELAQETARATEDIAGRVQTIQSDVGSAVAAIQQIGQVIARISDYQTTIASAVEEQTATTTETNRSVADAAGGVEQIATNIDGVAGAAEVTSQGVEEARATTEELARMSEQLRGLVSTFRYRT